MPLSRSPLTCLIGEFGRLNKSSSRLNNVPRQHEIIRLSAPGWCTKRLASRCKDQSSIWSPAWSHGVVEGAIGFTHIGLVSKGLGLSFIGPLDENLPQ